MGEFRINDLNPVNLTDNDDPYIEVDDPTWAESQKTPRSNFMQKEITARTDADNDIIDGAGLEPDGSLNPDPTSNYLENADFAAAGFNVNIWNGVRLLDIALGTIAGTLDITIQMDITSLEMLALNSNPVVKLVAPGAAKIIFPKHLMAKNTFNSAAYVSFGANGYYLRYVGSSDYLAHMDQTFLQSATTVRKVIPIVESEALVNTGLEFYAPDGDPTVGDGTFQHIFVYSIANDFGGGLAAPTCCVLADAGTFTNADLTAAGNLEIHHQLNSTNIGAVTIIDNTGVANIVAFARGDEGGADTSNYVTVNIGLGIPGTWTYTVIAKP